MNIIVAVDKNWGIGKNGDMLIYIPDDLKYFKEKTLKNVIVAGRKTVETFPNGKPLLDRVNIIMTRDKSYKNGDAIVCSTVDEVMSVVSDYRDKEVFVVGGESVYRQFLDKCDKAYVTKLDYSFSDVDTFMVNLDESPFWEVESQSETKYLNGIGYKFLVYKKI